MLSGTFIYMKSYIYLYETRYGAWLILMGAVHCCFEHVWSSSEGGWGWVRNHNVGWVHLQLLCYVICDFVTLYCNESNFGLNKLGSIPEPALVSLSLSSNYEIVHLHLFIC